MFRTGHATLERKLAACTGAANLDPEDRAEILVLLSADPDERVSSRASSVLATLAPADFIAAIGRADAAPQIFEYCGQYLADKTGIAEALIGHPGCPPATMVQAVKHLPEDVVDAMADNLNLLSLRPELAVVLLASPLISVDQRRTLEEVGQGAPDLETLTEAVKEAEQDPGKRESLLVRLSRMRVVERIQLAIKGGREERLALVRDSCRVVQRAVLQSPRLTEREAESFAGMANLSEEVLRGIAMNRIFRKNYIVIKNLMNNPKTPLDISLALVKHVHTPDLRTLTSNKNIPETLRTLAGKIFQQRKLRPS
jgi:hypothetical protein